MRDDDTIKLLKGMGIAFAITVVAYLVIFNAVEHNRVRRGPWAITFGTNAAGQATVTINESVLGIENVTLVFPDEELPSATAMTNVVFDAPRHVPFQLGYGECFYQDLTFLPGAVTLDLFKGHEVEMIQRVLFVNKTEHPWESGAVITVPGTNKLPFLIKKHAEEK